MENFPAFVFDSNLDAQERSLLMEIEMKEQLKIINDLRTLGASHNTITAEEKRLQELQAISYRYFRRDMMQVSKTIIFLIISVICLQIVIYINVEPMNPLDPLILLFVLVMKFQVVRLLHAIPLEQILACHVQNLLLLWPF